MALTTTSCMRVEQKRDFDLSVVLVALENVLWKTSNSHSESSSKSKQQSYCTAVDAINFSSFSKSPSLDRSHSSSLESFKDCKEEPVPVSASSKDDDDGEHTCASGSLDHTSLSESGVCDLDLASASLSKLSIDMDYGADLMVEEYLTAFTELTRFFKLTGPVFAFVARDLTKKMGIVQSHCSSKVGDNYRSLKAMIEYETKLGIVGNKGSKASGTRTMLRLHWALEFFIEFMDRLQRITEDTKSSTLVYETYEETLANHHPWWTRKLAYLAVHTLPSIKALIDIMCKQDYDEVNILLRHVVSIGRPILNHTSSLYASYNISNIP